MSDPRDQYVGEGGDGTDPELPESLPDPEPNTGPDEVADDPVEPAEDDTED